MVRKMVRKKIKVRSPKLPKFVEEKHVGFETTDWASVTDFEKSFRETLRHYGYFYDSKDYFKWGLEWVKKNLSPAKQKHFRSAEVWRLSVTAASMAKMELNGADLGQHREWMVAKIEEVVDSGKSKKVGLVKSFIPTKRRSPSEIIKDRTHEMIASIDAVVDDWENETSFSLYSDFQTKESAYVTAKAVYDYFIPLRDELVELVKKKTPDLVEGWSYLSIAKRTKLMKFVSEIVSDAKKYMATKKAARKPRAKKVVSTTSQLGKVKYLTSSKEYKITSIDPSLMVGATQVLLFNTKNRTLSRLVSSKKDGFTIKGTTLQDLDMELSSKKRLSKPDQFFGTISKTTKARAVKEYVALKTRGSPTTGRLGSETIILKAFK